MARPTTAVPEEPVLLRVNGRTHHAWSATPRALEPLAAGSLLAAGFLRTPAELRAIRVVREGATHVLETEVDPASAEAGFQEADHRAQHGCGLRYLVDCRPDLLPERSGPAAIPDIERFAALFRELFDRSPSRRESGGHHTTALSDGQILSDVFEEVGRHNGVDKAIGAAFLQAATLSGLGLLITARISGGIAEKAARAGVAWVASRSVPTTLAVEVARAAGLPLIGRAASPESRVFP